MNGVTRIMYDRYIVLPSNKKMKRFTSCLLIGLLLLLHQTTHAQLLQRDSMKIRIDTNGLVLRDFAASIVKDKTGNYAKAAGLLEWLGRNMEWKATDYQTRTVPQILARNGGNCFELATVFTAMIRELGIRYRQVAEINIQPVRESRQQTAAEKVATSGNRMSVFGRQHNDHRWVEIYDEDSKDWIPADPSMNVIGLTNWLKARVWFGERITIDTSITNDMLVPIGIFVTGSQKYEITEDRSEHYLIKSFNTLYQGKLEKLPSWKKWKTLIKETSPHCRAAFENKENLHQYASQIAELWDTYQSLKKEYGEQKKDSD